MTKYCNIYLVRHGHTEWNDQGLMQGHLDSPLTPYGLKQIDLRSKSLNKIVFTAAYSSDLGRAKTTADIIAKNHGLVVITKKLLREKYFGRLEGKKWLDVKEDLQKELEKREQLVLHERFKHKFYPEMESDEQGVTRLIIVLREISFAHLGENVLVVSHGGVMRALLVHLGFATFQELPSESIKNTGYVVLRCDGTDFFIDKTSGITKKVF